MKNFNTMTSVLILAFTIAIAGAAQSQAADLKAGSDTRPAEQGSTLSWGLDRID